MRLTFPKIILCAFLVSLTAVPVQSDTFDSYLKLKIKMDKDFYRLNQSVSGEVVITNSSSRTLPATFDTRLFHDGELFYQSSTEIKQVLPGPNRYDLKIFGIPSITKDSDAIGHWVLTIKQMNVHQSYRGYANFVVRR